MRKLIVLRGAPGAGKSTFIKNLGLTNFALSPDMFRSLIQSPYLMEAGDFKIHQMNGRREVWKMMMDVLEIRMRNGDLVIIDGTHSKISDIQNYFSYVEKYRYEMIIVDFTQVPIEVAKKNNLKREEIYHVPNKVIEKHYVRFKTEKIPKNIKVVPYFEADKIFQEEIHDFSHYQAVHHIGDVHGCYKVLMTYLDGGLKKDELYIFTGDYIDKGTENALVLEFLMSIADMPNVILLEGNHEQYLWKWTRNEDTRSLVFEYDTKPELERCGIKKQDVKNFCRKLKECVHYKYKDKEILVTHGGLSVIPKNLLLVSAEQLIYGVGDQKTSIDDLFNDNEKANNHFQIHGHRNYGLKPYTPDAKSFNLEGGIEAGGHLRTLTLTANGFKSVQIQNLLSKEKKVG